MENLEKTSVEARRKFVSAFNDTMVRIWRERISLLKVVDSGLLYKSLLGTKTDIGKDANEFQLEQQFVTYGIFQNYGTGKETPRGNPGDIGRAKVRKARQWFDKKYYGSVMNLRDFLGESLSQQYIGIVSNALSDRDLRASATVSDT